MTFDSKPNTAIPAISRDEEFMQTIPIRKWVRSGLFFRYRYSDTKYGGRERHEIDDTYTIAMVDQTGDVFEVLEEANDLGHH